MEAYLQKQKGSPAEWDALVNQDDAKERIKNCPAIEYNPKTGEYDVNPMLTEHMRQKMRVLKLMKEKGYERAMNELVWGRILTVKPEHYMIEGQKEYINETHRRKDAERGTAGSTDRYGSMQENNAPAGYGGIE